MDGSWKSLRWLVRAVKWEATCGFCRTRFSETGGFSEVRRCVPTAAFATACRWLGSGRPDLEEEAMTIGVVLLFAVIGTSFILLARTDRGEGPRRAALMQGWGVGLVLLAIVGFVACPEQDVTHGRTPGWRGC